MFWQLIALPFFFLLMFWGNFLSNDNAPKISRNASLLAVTLNIILDLILITGFHLGVKGASVATAISMKVLSHQQIDMCIISRCSEPSAKDLKEENVLYFFVEAGYAGSRCPFFRKVKCGSYRVLHNEKHNCGSNPS